MMQEKRIKKWEIVGALFLIGIGTLFHFLYDWSHQSPLVGVFSPINESIWEHLKIGFWPLILFSLLEYWFIKNQVHNFLLAKALGILTLQGIIVLVFYTYTSFTHKPIAFIDISSFFLGCLLCQLVSYKVLTKTTKNVALNWLGLILLMVNATLFVLFTFYPPQSLLFQEPKTYLGQNSSTKVAIHHKTRITNPQLSFLSHSFVPITR